MLREANPTAILIEYLTSKGDVNSKEKFSQSNLKPEDFNPVVRKDLGGQSGTVKLVSASLPGDDGITQSINNGQFPANVYAVFTKCSMAYKFNAADKLPQAEAAYSHDASLFDPAIRNGYIVFKQANTRKARVAVKDMIIGADDGKRSEEIAYPFKHPLVFLPEVPIDIELELAGTVDNAAGSHNIEFGLYGSRTKVTI